MTPPEALPLDSGRALPCTREGSSTLSTPISRLSWSLFHAMPACLSTGYPHCPPYPQVVEQTSNRSVHCEGVKGAIAKPPCRSRRSEIPLRQEKSSHTGKTHAKIRIAKRGYGEKSQIPLSSILPRKSAFEKPKNPPNSLPSTSWRIKIGLQKRIWHACSPADFIPPQSQWRCNCPLPRRSAAHLDAGERGLGGA